MIISKKTKHTQKTVKVPSMRINKKSLSLKAVAADYEGSINSL